MSKDNKQDEQQAIRQYLKRYGIEDQEGMVDMVTWVAEELAKEWGLAPTQLHQITGYNWAKEISELAAKHRGFGDQVEKMPRADAVQVEGDAAFVPDRKYKPLKRGSIPWRKHKRRWEKIEAWVEAGMKDKEILANLKRLDRPVRNGPMANRDRGYKLSCSAKTLHRTIEAGMAGDFDG